MESEPLASIPRFRYTVIFEGASPKIKVKVKTGDLCRLRCGKREGYKNTHCPRLQQEHSTSAKDPHSFTIERDSQLLRSSVYIISTIHLVPVDSSLVVIQTD